MDIYIHTHNEILLSHKTLNLAICHKVDGHRGYNAKHSLPFHFFVTFAMLKCFNLLKSHLVVVVLMPFGALPEKNTAKTSVEKHLPCFLIVVLRISS